MEPDFDHIDQEEKQEMEEVETALKGSLVNFGGSNNDFMQSQQTLLSERLWAHCIAHLVQLIIKDGLKAIGVRIFSFGTFTMTF
jgi:hypothetical protein